MDESIRDSTPQRSYEQWRTLYETLRGCGVLVDLMPPQPGLPDLVFTANAGLIFGRRVLSRDSATRFAPGDAALRGLVHGSWLYG